MGIVQFDDSLSLIDPIIGDLQIIITGVVDDQSLGKSQRRHKKKKNEYT
jgi:hypothetical protein